MRRTSQDDLYMQQLTRQSSMDPTEPYSMQNGICFYKRRVVVPQAIRNQLLKEFHDSKMAGHSGLLRTFERLAQQFHWPSMYRSAQEYITQCDVCQKTKTETLAPVWLLQPFPIPCQVWDDLTLDFIEGLPPSHDKDSLLVVVNRLSKYAHFVALSYPFFAKIVAKHFVKHVIKLHNMPKSIISDCNPVFVIEFWQEFFTMSGTKLKLSSPTTHRPTDKLKLWTVVLNNNFAISSINGHENCIVIYLEQNSSITPPTIAQRGWHLSKLCMVGFLPQFRCILMGYLGFMKLIKASYTGTNYSSTWRRIWTW